MCFQCASSGLPVAFQWFSSVFQLCKLTLDRHWNTTGCYHQPVWFQWHHSVLVAPVVFQCGLSSGIPVYWHNLVWRSLGQVTSQHATTYVYNWYDEFFELNWFHVTFSLKYTTRGLSAYTARSSFKFFSIATNACMWMLAKQGERRIKKVIKGIHLMQFAQHIHLLFWAKDHFHLNKRPDSLISR